MAALDEQDSQNMFEEVVTGFEVLLQQVEALRTKNAELQQQMTKVS